MILELVLQPIFSLINGLLDFFPTVTLDTNFDVSGIMGVLEMSFIFFPLDLFQFIISNVVFWLEVQLGWAIVEWIYKKIPGVS